MERIKIDDLEKKVKEYTALFLIRCAEIMIAPKEGVPLSQLIFDNPELIKGVSGGDDLKAKLQSSEIPDVDKHQEINNTLDITLAAGIVKKTVSGYIEGIKKYYDDKMNVIKAYDDYLSQLDGKTDEKCFDKLKKELRDKYNIYPVSSGSENETLGKEALDAAVVPDGDSAGSKDGEEKKTVQSEKSSGMGEPITDDSESPASEATDEENEKQKSDLKRQLIEHKATLLDFLAACGLAGKKASVDARLEKKENSFEIEIQGILGSKKDEDARLSEKKESITVDIQKDILDPRNDEVHGKRDKAQSEYELRERVKKFRDHINEWNFIFSYAAKRHGKDNDLKSFYCIATGLYHEFDSDKRKYVTFETVCEDGSCENRDYYNLNELIRAMCGNWREGLELFKGDVLHEFIASEYKPLLAKYNMIQTVRRAVSARESRMRIDELMKVNNLIQGLNYDLQSYVYANMYDACMFRFVYEMNPGEEFFCWKRLYRPDEFAEAIILPNIKEKSAAIERRVLYFSELFILAEYNLFSFYFKQKNLLDNEIKADILKIKTIEYDIQSFCRNDKEAPKLFELYAQLWRLAKEFGGGCLYEIKDPLSGKVIEKIDSLSPFVDRIRGYVMNKNTERAGSLISANSFADFRGWLRFTYNDKKHDEFFDRHIGIKHWRSMWNDCRSYGNGDGYRFQVLLRYDGESLLQGSGSNVQVSWDAARYLPLSLALNPGIGIISNAEKTIQIDRSFIEENSFFNYLFRSDYPVSDDGITCDRCERFVSLMTAEPWRDENGQDIREGRTNACEVRKSLLDQYEYVWVESEGRSGVLTTKDTVLSDDNINAGTFRQRKIICLKQSQNRDKLLAQYAGIGTWYAVSRGDYSGYKIKDADGTEGTDFRRVIGDLKSVYDESPIIDRGQFVLSEYYGVICSSPFRSFTADSVASDMYGEYFRKTNSVRFGGCLRTLKKSIRKLEALKTEVESLYTEFDKSFFKYPTGLIIKPDKNSEYYCDAVLELDSNTKTHIGKMHEKLINTIVFKKSKTSAKRKRRIALLIIALVAVAAVICWKLFLQK